MAGQAQRSGKVLLGPLPTESSTPCTRPWEIFDGLDRPLPLLRQGDKGQDALTMLIIGIVAWRFAINSEVRENSFALDAEFYVTSQAVDVRFDVGSGLLSVVTYETACSTESQSTHLRPRVALLLVTVAFIFVSMHRRYRPVILHWRTPVLLQRLSLRLTHPSLEQHCHNYEQLMLLSLRYYGWWAADEWKAGPITAPAQSRRG